MKAWYRKLDQAWDSLTKGGSEEWSRILDDRLKAKKKTIPSGNKLMERLIVAIAYSQGAPSDQVQRIIASGHLRESFHGFDIETIAADSQKRLLKHCWKAPLTCIRFKGKIAAIVDCAQILRDIETEHGSFAIYLKNFQVPRRITTSSDIHLFWEAFDRLQVDLKARNIPFFSNTTSLLQLLLDLDYDSVKPDLIVMRVAKQWGIVARETGNPAFREAVQAFQQYGVDQQRRPLAVDWVVLTHGKQKGALAIWDGKIHRPNHLNSFAVISKKN